MNPDAYFEDAYLALLANTIMYLFTDEEPSQYRNNFFD